MLKNKQAFDVEQGQDSKGVSLNHSEYKLPIPRFDDTHCWRELRGKLHNSDPFSLLFVYANVINVDRHPFPYVSSIEPSPIPKHLIESRQKQ